MRKRRSRRRAVGTRAPIVVEAAANARWSLDFLHDQLACGRRFRILNIVDDVTRECLAAIPDTSISGRRVARELTALIEHRGKPGMIVSDNGTEFTSNAVFAWARETGSSGIPLRQESRCRTASARVQRAHARRASRREPVPRPRSCAIKDRELDRRLRPARPHSALGYLTPTDYAANLSATRDRLRNPDQLRRSHVAPPRPTA